MWNIPSNERLAKLPGLYETEFIPLQQKAVHLHLFIADCDWYCIEFDGKDIFWGFAILHNDYRNAEFGYFSLSEMMPIKVGGYLEIDCELEEHWTVQPAIEIEKIRKAQGW